MRPSAEAFALQAASTPGAVIIYGMSHQQYQDAVATSNAVKQLPAALATLTAAVQAIPTAGGTGVLTVNLTGTAGPATPTGGN